MLSLSVTLTTSTIAPALSYTTSPPVILKPFELVSALVNPLPTSVNVVPAPVLTPATITPGLGMFIASSGLTSVAFIYIAFFIYLFIYILLPL